MDKNVFSIFSNLTNSKIKKSDLKKVLNLLISNKFIYDYIQKKNTIPLSDLHGPIYKHIRDNIQLVLFEEIKTYLHPLIDEYASFLESNTVMQNLLINRFVAVSDRAQQIKKEMVYQLSDDEENDLVSTDIDIWLIAENQITNNLTLGFL